MDRGGKGMLLGDSNDFQEYAKNYYGVESKMQSVDLKKVSAENEVTHKVVHEEVKKTEANINPLNFTISNPESPLLYYIINEILNKNLFGSKDIFVRLYTQNKSAELEGVKMEIEDLASKYLRNIKIVHTAEEAFTNCDFALLLDELELIPSNTEDLEQQYKNPYISLSKQLDEYAKATCKILISPYESRNEIYALVNLTGSNLKKINPKKI